MYPPVPCRTYTTLAPLRFAVTPSPLSAKRVQTPQELAATLPPPRHRPRPTVAPEARRRPRPQLLQPGPKATPPPSGERGFGSPQPPSHGTGRGRAASTRPPLPEAPTPRPRPGPGPRRPPGPRRLAGPAGAIGGGGAGPGARLPSGCPWFAACFCPPWRRRWRRAPAVREEAPGRGGGRRHFRRAGPGAGRPPQPVAGGLQAAAGTVWGDPRPREEKRKRVK